MKHAWIWRGVVAALFAGWIIGLGGAAMRLGEWQSELVHTLLQMRADRALRVRMAQRHEPIPREWYRSKALALLAAADKLRDDSGWLLFMPGSWRGVDNLRERLTQRIEREFADIAVEAVRRELDFQASELTGAPRQQGTGELLANAGCADPLLPNATAPQQLGELQSVQSHLDAIEQLDAAVQALLALQSRGTTDPQAFRLLVRYTLDADLPPGRSLRSADWFRQVLGPADPAQQAVRIARLQAAVRCSLGKRMLALDARLFERSDLVQTEAALSLQTAALLHPAAMQQAGGSALAGWRRVVALISLEEELLGQGDNGWMKGDGHGLGPVHEAVLARVGQISLLGPDAVRQLRQQSGAALQRLHRQLAGLERRTDPAMVWVEGQGRFALSPERVALRDHLSALLQEPLMSAPRQHVLPDATSAAPMWDATRLEQVLALASAHKRFAADRLPNFPAAMRPAIARLMDTQFAQQVEDGAVEAMALTREAGAPLDVLSWHAGRQAAAQIQALLARLGARTSAERLRRLLAGDLAARLAAADRVWAGSVFASPRLQDFGWWQGEDSPILRALAVGDALTLRYVLRQQVSQLGEAVRQAAPVLQEARGADAPAAVLRWQAIAAELDRARAGHPDNSLSALVQTLVVIGPELQRATCADRLAALPMPRGGTDEFAQRHRRMLEALARRCRELRPGSREPKEVPFPAVFSR